MEHLGPVMVEEKVFGGNWKTTIRKVEDRDLVLKVDMTIQNNIERKDGEDDQGYRGRRLLACLDFIKRDRKETVDVDLPNGVTGPREDYFIADGEDGFPVPFRVQGLVDGEVLKKVYENMTFEQKDMLDEVVAASLKAYARSGKMLDITGWDQEEPGKFKWLWNSVADPLRGSCNIMVSKDEKVVMIDMKTSFQGDSLARRVGRFVHFVGVCGWYVTNEIKKSGRRSLDLQDAVDFV